MREFVHPVFTGNTSPTIIVLTMAKLQPQETGVGWAAVSTYGDRNLPASAFTFRQGGADFAVSSVQLFSNGQIEVTIAGGRDNAGYLQFQPFIQELNTPEGEMCAGALIYVPSPV